MMDCLKKGNLVGILQIWPVAETSFLPLHFDLIQPNLIGMVLFLPEGVGLPQCRSDHDLVPVPGFFEDTMDDRTCDISPIFGHMFNIQNPVLNGLQL